MELLSDDVVVVKKGKNVEDPRVITVNCPDKTGLGCDICRIILDFGLYITKGDVSTDGIWCYVVLWVVPHSSSLVVRWTNLKNRLLSVCPSYSISFRFIEKPICSASSPVYLLKFFCLDRKGLLHDVTGVLCDLELTIQRVKVTTTPDGRVLDLFFITDSIELLHTIERQNEILGQLRRVLGKSCISCELQFAGPHFESHQGISSLSAVVADELCGSELPDKEICGYGLCPDFKKLTKTSITVDNSLSPGHTLLQIHTADHKGLLYDVMRTLKDSNIQISFGRFLPSAQGYRDLDLFIQQNDGKKILDPEKQKSLSSRLKLEIMHALRVIITNRGPDFELLVANPVELSGNGRPRVFYDATLALKTIGICIFSAEIGRHSAHDREWEVYRFLLDENCNEMVSRNQIVERVRRTLMGWKRQTLNCGSGSTRIAIKTGEEQVCGWIILIFLNLHLSPRLLILLVLRGIMASTIENVSKPIIDWGARSLSEGVIAEKERGQLRF